MSHIILDLDNCISDDEWRIDRINHHHPDRFVRYHEYQLLAGFDKFKDNELIDWECKIIISTARPEFYRSITHEWLKRNNINPIAIYMRPDQDYRPSAQLKASHLRHMMITRINDIECAYDDREDVVEMYRKFDVKAQLVKIHNNTKWGDEQEKQNEPDNR